MMMGRCCGRMKASAMWSRRTRGAPHTGPCFFFLLGLHLRVPMSSANEIPGFLNANFNVEMLRTLDGPEGAAHSGHSRIHHRVHTKMSMPFKRLARGCVARGYATVASLLPSARAAPTVECTVSVARAAQVMAEQHVDAITLTKEDRVVGLFTERDYFEKVLDARHQATPSSVVAEVGTVGSNLIVARPEDSVEDCLSVMMSSNLMAMPVVERDGHAMGVVTLLDLTKPLFDAQQERCEIARFSEASFFPEDLVLPDGGVHDEERDDPDQWMQLAEDPTTALLEHVDHALEERAAQAFCEGSMFPEFEPAEEILLVETQANAQPSAYLALDAAREERLSAAHTELLGAMEQAFSEPSDFPEAAPADEAIYARAA